MDQPRVILVGAGPGAADLLTLRALRALQAAEVVIHDRLVSPEVLALVPRAARLIPVGKASGHHPVPQAQINRLLIDFALCGLSVVRLKGGDPFVFGRGGEEAEALRAAGVALEVVPGITAAQGASASLGLPLTQRGLVTGLRYVTAHCRADLPLDMDWPGLANPDTTLVVYMGGATIGRFAERLIAHGMPASLPVLAVSSATLPAERHVASTLGRASATDALVALPSPVLFVIGRVVELLPAREIAAAVWTRSAEIAAHA